MIRFPFSEQPQRCRVVETAMRADLLMQSCDFVLQLLWQSPRETQIRSPDVEAEYLTTRVPAPQPRLTTLFRMIFPGVVAQRIQESDFPLRSLAELLSALFQRQQSHR